MHRDQPEDFPPPEMTPEEFGRCRPATEADHLEAAVPTHLISNGEYFPPFFQTAEQKQVENHVTDLTETGAKKIGMSRRQFLATSGGMAACFIALNEVFRSAAAGETLFQVGKDGVYDHDAFVADGPPSDLFVFDDQLHIVRGQGGMGHIGSLLRVLAQGETARTPNSPYPVNPFNPEELPDEHGDPWGTWNPRLINRMNWDDEEYWLHNFIKYVYFESQTTVGLISNVASGTATNTEEVQVGTRNVREARVQELLTAEQTFASRDFINELAGSTRAMGHGLLYMGRGNIHYLEEQIERFGPDSWKGYQNAVAKRDDDPNTTFEEWRFDDEELAFPTFEFLVKNYRKNRHRKPAQNCVNVHKGLGESSRPEDIPAAAEAFPELNFIIYHSCIRPGFFMYNSMEDVRSGRLRDGVPDILDVAEFAQLVAPYPNVYSELGTTFASCVVTFPTVCAHVLGILFKYLGADRIVWGTDSTWYGSPQWQIEAFWRFRIPDAFKKAYGYPELTEGMKRKVLGLNSARLYKLSPNLRNYTTVPYDYYDRMTSDDELMAVMEYDNRLPKELPIEEPSAGSAYGPAFANRNDKLDRMRGHYQDMHATRGGVPLSNQRHGFIRVR